jgi:ADP-dependent NAD(P)H-hydrate dehydratase / NAD(P)H-hydrate epimerase
VSATLPAPTPVTPASVDPRTGIVLPVDDTALMTLGLPALVKHWSAAKDLPPMAAEAMTGADRKAQRLGVPGGRLMEQAGTAVAAAVRAVAVDQGRLERGPILILCGPGNNGGDGFVAARRLAHLGLAVLVVFVASEPKPGTRDATVNWDRLANEPRVTRIHAPSPRDLAIVGQGIEKASVVVDALLGTGVRGALRDPIWTAVELIRRAAEAGVPVVAVDTPTAIDLTSGEASAPAVRADLTVTFHRPKAGLLTRRGAAFAGKVLVAPIGIPLEADRA